MIKLIPPELQEVTVDLGSLRPRAIFLNGNRDLVVQYIDPQKRLRRIEIFKLWESKFLADR